MNSKEICSNEWTVIKYPFIIMLLYKYNEFIGDKYNIHVHGNI